VTSNSADGATVDKPVVPVMTDALARVVDLTALTSCCCCYCCLMLLQDPADAQEGVVVVRAVHGVAGHTQSRHAPYPPAARQPDQCPHILLIAPSCVLAPY